LFSGKAKVARYIDPDQVFRGRYPAPDAFIASGGDSHLSVHALEIESKADLALRYRRGFQNGRGAVRMSIQSIYDYNAASAQTPGAVKYNSQNRNWEFTEKGDQKPAYMQRATPDCDSHFGVEFIRVLNEAHALKVARVLARRKFDTVRSR